MFRGLHKVAILTSALGAALLFGAPGASATPATGCVANNPNVFPASPAGTPTETCTLVEVPDVLGEPVITTTSVFLPDLPNGFVPIYEPAGHTSSTLPPIATGSGVFTNLSDVLVITGNANLALYSDGLSAADLATLESTVAGLTEITALANDGTTVLGVAGLTEPVGLGGVSFNLLSIQATPFLDRYVVVSDVPEPISLSVLGIGLIGLGVAVRRRRPPSG